ncbi:MAG TPA: hypothetical protein ENN87_09905 [Phycisphaerales bacterium]|nr:hypothetical protein [Phycisphaerales bacterium]
MKARILSVGLMSMMLCGVAMGLGRSQGSKEKVAEPAKPAPKQAQPQSSTSQARPPVAPAQRVERKTPAARPAQPASTQPVAQPAQPAAQPQAAPAPVDPGKVFATVNGVKITAGQVEPVLEQFVQRQLASLGPIGSALPPDALIKLKERARPRVVEMFVEQELVSEQIKAKNIEVTDEQLDAHIGKLLADNEVTLEDVKKDLERNGQTLEEFRKQMRTNLGVERLVEGEMKGKVEPIDEAAAKKFYDENPGQFTVPEQVRASHILIKTEGLDEAGKQEARTRIQDILAKVKAGEDFAELAKTYSGCPSSSQGGDLDFFDRTRMVPEFAEAAFKLKVGEISDIVETKFGYHIIKVTDHKDPETVTFESQKENIIENLTQRQQVEFWNQYRQQLKAKAQIEYADEIKEAMQPPAAQPAAPKAAPTEPPKAD